ncbi:MAG: undecaprenyl-diphosphate phosphatase [Rhodobacteraceae bacterium]|nr:undecaprenyl-diphosphate phosphatase [Paracoccaceae bacterium]
MSLLPLLILGLVQGATEFLPISSSGHLVLVSMFHPDWDQGHLIDAAAHLGTLVAVVIAFRRDLHELLIDAAAILRGRQDAARSWLVVHLALATIPVAVAGLILHMTGAITIVRNITAIGTTTLTFGLVLYLADRLGSQDKTLRELGWRSALIIGIFQVLSLVPGTSRSGITITAGRMLGYGRQDAIKISILLSIPTIILVSLFSLSSMTYRFDLTALAAAGLVAGISFIVGLCVISLLLRLHRTVSFTPYVIYRVILGSVLLALAW